MNVVTKNGKIVKFKEEKGPASLQAMQDVAQTLLKQAMAENATLQEELLTKRQAVNKIFSTGKQKKKEKKTSLASKKLIRFMKKSESKLKLLLKIMKNELMSTLAI